MPDFHQPGVVATLHRLTQDHSRRLEKELDEISKKQRIGLVLPTLYSEFETPSMRRIINELAEVRYLRHIVVALGKAGPKEFDKVQAFFDGFSHPITILWIESQPIQDLLALLEEHGLPVGADGKGRSCWLAYGYLLATGECDVIALHDCDILNYSRQLLARLVYPAAHPNLSFEFCKGYYPRITDKMHGRVTRLFMTPLIRSLQSLVRAPFLDFLDGFRYPLAGEFAMKADLAWINRIPCDWGLEVGVLAEAFHNCPAARICQVDLADNYEHKHQELSSENPEKGLRRMACDIAKSLMRTLAGQGLVLTTDHLRSLEVRYVCIAEDMIGRYQAEALFNGLEFDRHAEALAVATFAKSLTQAAAEFTEAPLGFSLLPNWKHVAAAFPACFDHLLRSVEVEAPLMRSYGT